MKSIIFNALVLFFLALMVSRVSAAEVTNNNGILEQYSVFYGMNEHCKTLGLDSSAKINEFLDSKLLMMTAVLADKKIPKDAQKELSGVVCQLESRKPIDQVVTDSVKFMREEDSASEVCSKMPSHIDGIISQDKLIMQLKQAVDSGGQK